MKFEPDRVVRLGLCMGLLYVGIVVRLPTFDLIVVATVAAGVLELGIQLRSG